MKLNSLPLVSVIIPNFNYANYVGEAIDSALNQTHKNLEVIVIDDGSQDNSLSILQKYSKEVTIIATRNYGASIARNFGILQSRGELIAFLDADDIWHPSKIEMQLKCINLNKTELCFCSMTTRAFNEVRKDVNGVKSNISLETFFNNPTSTPFSPSTVLIRRELLGKAGIWNTSLTSPGEDFDLFRRCARFERFCFLPQSLVFHREHHESLTASNSLRYFQDNLRILRIMFAEDRRHFSFVSRMQAWLKVHQSYSKHAIKHRNIGLLIRVTKSCLFGFL